MNELRPGASLPEEIETSLLAVLDLPVAEHESALAKLCAVHPQHEQQLRVYLSLYRRLAASSHAPSSVLDRIAAPLPDVRPRVHLRMQDEPPAPEPQGGAGATRGKYVSRRLLDEGGMGQVYRAHDRELGRDVALKLLHERHRDRPDVVHRFLDEAQIGAQLQHPGIAPVYELGVEGDRPFFAMRLVQGETLAKRLAARANPLATLSTELATFDRICQTVAYAHACGVIHRDLKPQNVVIGKFGEVQVLDWGLSKVLSLGVGAPSETPDEAAGFTTSRDHGWHSVAGSVLGTPAYMAPEQARGDPEHVDERTDVFGLGAILCEILTGAPPHVGTARHAKERQEEELRLAARGDLDAVAARLTTCGADRALVDLACACLDPIPARRPAHAGEVAARVGAYLASVEARARQAIIDAQTARVEAAAARQRQRLLAAIAAVVLAGLGVSVWLWRAATDAAESARVANGHAQESLRRFNLVANVVKLRDLKREEARLYPARPRNVGAMEAWLGEAASLSERLPELRTTLQEMDAAALEPAGEFLRGTLAQLVADLTELAQPDGLVEGMRRRLDWAKIVAELTIDRYQGRWAQARAAIQSADGLTASELYRAVPVDLQPQIGLVPIGMNPRTKLWEFYDLRSAWDRNVSDPRDVQIPTHAADGSIAVGDDTGIVFVLLPGGTFAMGAQASDRTAANYDPRAEESEGPVRPVTLAPFFLARHEMTQGQWVRLSEGSNPSIYGPGPPLEGTTEWTTLAYPVENVTWSDCDALFRLHGLVLPTEAQWEYGCRAGTTTPWWTGADRTSLIANGIAANLADQAAIRAGNPSYADVAADWPELDDSYPATAPVDALRANPWGLHHVHGNVREWCLDRFGSYDLPVRAKDGLRLVPEDGRETRMERGGTHDLKVWEARSSSRSNFAPGGTLSNRGVRPARALDPE